MSVGSDGLPNEKEIVKENIKRYPVLCSRDQALINLVSSVIISWAGSEKSCKLSLFSPIRNTLDNQAFYRYSSSLHGKPGLFNTLRAFRLKPGFPGYSELFRITGKTLVNQAFCTYDLNAWNGLV